MENLSYSELVHLNGGGPVHHALGFVYEVVKTAYEWAVETAMDHAIENSMDTNCD